MSIELTEEQRQAVRQGEPVRVRVPDVGGDFVLLRAEQYETIRESLEDEKPAQPVGPERNTNSEESIRIIRRQYAANRLLTIIPTVLLAGMYGAAAFAIFSFGPPWVGFLIGAIPILGIAAWAFADRSEGLGT